MPDFRPADIIAGMTYFRIALVQRTMVVLFLLISLLMQTQVVFACEMMEGQSSTVCCCDDAMSAGCPMDESLQKTDEGCCEITVEVLSDAAMEAPGSAAVQVTLLDGPQPPPLLADGAIAIITARPSPVFSLRFRTLPVFDGVVLYRLTRRIRI